MWCLSFSFFFSFSHLAFLLLFICLTYFVGFYGLILLSLDNFGVSAIFLKFWKKILKFSWVFQIFKKFFTFFEVYRNFTMPLRVAGLEPWVFLKIWTFLYLFCLKKLKFSAKIFKFFSCFFWHLFFEFYCWNFNPRGW